MTSHSLNQRLDELKRRLLALTAAIGASWGFLAAIALLIVSMWMDLIVDMPPALRLFAVLGCIVAAAITFIRVFSPAMRSTKPVDLARRLDDRSSARGEIVSAVDLLGSTHLTDAPAISVGLAHLAIRRAERLAERTDTRQVLPSDALHKPIYIAIGFIVFVIAMAIFSPRLVKTQWLRFAQPFADHAPYSRITFDVEPGDAKVIYGSNLELRVTPRGGDVERLDIVLQPDGAAEETLPMFPGTDGRWQATIASITQGGKYFVRAPGGKRTAKFAFDVITVPKITDVRLRITPPAYTHRPPYEGPLPQGGVIGLAGTDVQIWLKSNRPLSGGTMQVASPGADTWQSAFTGAASEATGTFALRANGTVTAKVTDSAGQSSTDTFTAPITLLADEKPFVRMLEPKAQSYATPDVTIPVVLAAEDDCGVARLQLYRGLNESRATSEELFVPPTQPVRLRGNAELGLSQYGLKPGDAVKLYARVEDNDPAGAKGSESPIAVIRIISAEQMQRMQLSRDGMEVLQSKYAQAMRRLEQIDKQIEQLQKELEKLDPNSELAKAKRDQIDKLADEMNKQAEAIDEAAKMDLPFDIDMKFGSKLKELAQQVRDAADDAKKLAAQPGLSAGQAGAGLGEMRKKLGVQREQFEQEVTEPLEHLAKILPVKQDEARFIELYQHQRELEQRMQSLRGQDGKDDPKLKARMRDLEEEQAQIQQDLRDLLADIENHVAQLPEDPKLDDLRNTAREFAQALRGSGADEEMTSAQASLVEFKGTAAHDSAKLAADILEQFISKCNSMGDQAGECLKFNPNLSEALGDTVEQMLEAMGMGSKPGNGSGNGGGYSARRSTLNNVGLYGRLPTRSSPSNGGEGNRLGAAADGSGDPDDASDPLNGPGSRSSVTGEAGASVPPQYRRRVGEYFRRVSDELSEKKK